jgi:hypothetical protein
MMKFFAALLLANAYAAVALPNGIAKGRNVLQRVMIDAGAPSVFTYDDAPTLVIPAPSKRPAAIRATLVVRDIVVQVT